MSVAAYDVDLLGSASHENMATQLIAPLAGGAVRTVIAPDATGTLTVDWPTRFPIVLAAPSRPLGEERWLLEATPSWSPLTSSLDFQPYAEAGAFLPLPRPTADATGRVASFGYTLALWQAAGASPPDTSNQPQVATIASQFAFVLVEGNLGLLTYLLGAEKQRIRGSARELAAARFLSTARLDALDRIGADLAVPRLSGTLEYKNQEIVVAGASPESDDNYRRRLGIYRPLLRATPARVSELVADIDARLTVDEAIEPFPVAMLLVDSGDQPIRNEFLNWVKSTYLVWVSGSATAKSVMKARPTLSDMDAAAMNGLGRYFSFAENEPKLAPFLADALLRLGRCYAALTDTRLRLLTSQRDDGGSRFELGLGAAIMPPPPSKFGAIIDRLSGAEPLHGDPNPAETARLLAALRPPAHPDDDPQWTWLLKPCGLTTSHAIGEAKLYVSHLATGGLVIDGPSHLDVQGYDAVLGGSWTGMSQEGELGLYDRGSGALSVLAVGDLSNITTIATQPVGKNWTHVVAAAPRFDGQNCAFLLYASAAGRWDVWEAVQMSLRRATFAGLPTDKTWTHLATAAPFDYTPSHLAVYDAVSGELRRYAGDATRTFTRVATIESVGRWTHLAAGDFGGGTGFDVVLYDANHGTAVLYTGRADGSFVEARAYTGWRAGCSLVASGDFGSVPAFSGPPPQRDLLLFDPQAAEAIAVRLEHDGAATTVAVYPTSRSVTHIVSAQIAGAPGVVAYERPNGIANLYAVRGKGKLDRLKTFTDWPASVAAGVSNAYVATYHAYGDVGTNAVLAEALAAAAVTWQADERDPWTATSSNEWANAANNAPAAATFAAAGLAAPASAAAVQALSGLAQDLLATLRLPKSLEDAVLQGGGANELRLLADMLAVAGIGALLPLVTNDDHVLVIVAVTSLPGGGAVMIQPRRVIGFHWYAASVVGLVPELISTATGVELNPGSRGLSVVVAVADLGGSPAPYRFRVGVTGSPIGLTVYEQLMNVLDRVCPLGVGVDTWSLRRTAVDLDGDGSADPLQPTISRTYRTFYRPRLRGHVEPSAAD